jgi:hypothetical protein
MPNRFAWFIPKDPKREERKLLGCLCVVMSVCVLLGLLWGWLLWA